MSRLQTNRHTDTHTHTSLQNHFGFFGPAGPKIDISTLSLNLKIEKITVVDLFRQNSL